MNKILIIFLTLLSSVTLCAQSSILPNEGKMFTTVLVLSAVLVGIFLFLFFLERKISKLENQIKDES